jgi:hypothetical protein
MRITTYATWKSMNDFVAGKPADQSISYEHEGSVGLCNRAAASQAKGAASAAGNTASQLGTTSQNELGTLTPFFQREMKAEHLYDPTQMNELLTAAEAPNAAVTGTAQAEAEGNAARTHNATALTKTLQEMQRDKMKADAGASEGIAAQDVMGAKNLNQEGAAGEGGLYGENLKGQLAAMGAQGNDINSEIEAGKSGWLQNMTGVISSLGSLAGGAGSAMKGFKS